MKPIEHADLSYLVYKKIREMIFSGMLKPGEKLPQEKIAGMLGVSRMPLHKAFVRLEDELLVESVPRRGIFIRKPDPTEILEAFECREGLEGIAARRAADLLSSAEIDALGKLFDPFRESRSIDEVEYQQADRRFHEKIINASGNTLLVRLNTIGSFLVRSYPGGIILTYEESMKDHDAIIRAFAERRGDIAEEVIREHSRKARRIIGESLEASNQL